jgi:hypothetical protein
MAERPDDPPERRVSRLRTPVVRQLLGVALFLFIPAVLFLFVVHPAPVAGSFALGAALMVGHRFLAGPYFRAIRETNCAWCHRAFGVARPPAHALDLAAGGETLALFACPAHVEPTRRFFDFLDRARWPLRIGIALPLGLLVAALLAASFGHADDLEPATELFRFAVGLTVQFAALGPWAGAPAPTATAAFPVHNVYLLGVRAILWIFRLVGLWWIVSAGRYWLAA